MFIGKPRKNKVFFHLPSNTGWKSVLRSFVQVTFKDYELKPTQSTKFPV